MRALAVKTLFAVAGFVIALALPVVPIYVVVGDHKALAMGLGYVVMPGLLLGVPVEKRLDFESDQDLDLLGVRGVAV
jgi:hypothetical protein